jgi:hypothetical protein
MEISNVFFPRTWISLQLALNEVVGEWAELFDSTYSNIIVIRFLSFFIQFVVHLDHRKDCYRMASQEASLQKYTFQRFFLE